VNDDGEANPLPQLVAKLLGSAPLPTEEKMPVIQCLILADLKTKMAL
jgi:hypothetical protein